MRTTGCTEIHEEKFTIDGGRTEELGTLSGKWLFLLAIDDRLLYWRQKICNLEPGIQIGKTCRSQSQPL